MAITMWGKAGELTPMLYTKVLWTMHHEGSANDQAAPTPA